MLLTTSTITTAAPFNVRPPYLSLFSRRTLSTSPFVLRSSPNSFQELNILSFPDHYRIIYLYGACRNRFPPERSFLNVLPQRCQPFCSGGALKKCWSSRTELHRVFFFPRSSLLEIVHCFNSKCFFDNNNCSSENSGNFYVSSSSTSLFGSSQSSSHPVLPFLAPRRCQVIQNLAKVPTCLLLYLIYRGNILPWTWLTPYVFCPP